MSEKTANKRPWLLALAAIVVVAVIIAVVLLSQPAKPAPAQATDVPTVTQEPVTAGTASTTDPAEVLATVNGLNITRGELEAYADNLMEYYTSQGYDMSDASYADIMKQLAMTTLVQYRLMDDQLAVQGMQLTADEKAAAEAAAKTEWEATLNDGKSYYGVTEASTAEEEAAALVKVLADLESMGYTEASYIEESVLYAGYDKLQAHVVKDVTVSDDDVAAHFAELVAADELSYKDNAEAYENTQQMNQMYLMYGMSDYATPQYYMPEGYRGMSHILLTPDEALLTAYQDLEAKFEEQQSALEEGAEVTETLVTEEEVEAARLAIIANVQPTLDEINAKLAEGTAFADLIPVYSQDPGMTEAAAIAEGYAVHMDSIMWDPVFRDAAFTVENIGDITAPVVGSYGVHVLQYVRDIPGGAVELTAELQASLKEELLAAEQSNVYAEALLAWEDAAKIEYFGDAAVFMAPAEEAAETTDTPAAE